MSLNFIWCISYNWPDAVWAQSFQTAWAVSQAALSDSFSPHPPAVLDYYSSYMAGHMYSFCFLITLKIFQGKTEPAYSCLIEFFDRRSEDYSEKEKKKKIHSPKELWGMNCKGPKPDWAALLGRVAQSCSSLFLSSPLDFHMFNLVKARSSPSSGKWKIPGSPGRFGFAGKFVGGAGEEPSLPGRVRPGEAGLASAAVSLEQSFTFPVSAERGGWSHPEPLLGSAVHYTEGSFFAWC